MFDLQDLTKAEESETDEDETESSSEVELTHQKKVGLSYNIRL